MELIIEAVKLLTQTEFAEYAGISQPAVSLRLKKGHLHWAVDEHGNRGIDLDSQGARTVILQAKSRAAKKRKLAKYAAKQQADSQSTTQSEETAQSKRPVDASTSTEEVGAPTPSDPQNSDSGEEGGPESNTNTDTDTDTDAPAKPPTPYVPAHKRKAKGRGRRPRRDSVGTVEGAEAGYDFAAASAKQEELKTRLLQLKANKERHDALIRTKKFVPVHMVNRMMGLVADGLESNVRTFPERHSGPLAALTDSPAMEKQIREYLEREIDAAMMRLKKTLEIEAQKMKTE